MEVILEYDPFLGCIQILSMCKESWQMWVPIMDSFVDLWS